MSPGFLKVVTVPTATPLAEMSETASMCTPLVTGVTFPGELPTGR